MKQTFSLLTITDYIKETYPTLKWWNGVSAWADYKEEVEFKHRQSMPNEIRIEFDSKDNKENWNNINLTAVNLWKAKYSFAIFYVEGGRSPHIHIYDIDEMDVALDEEQRTEYRGYFLNKYCPKGSNPDKGLCNEKHLCALEFVNHFKYGVPKKLLSYFWQGKNMGCDDDILFDKMNYPELKKKKFNTKDMKKLKFGDMLKQNTRNVIIDNLNFETVFDKYGIKYKGKMALCPFHADSDNSLSFSNEKGLWKCFGCDKQGDIISLIKYLEERK